jgi:hypothetical protein
VSTSPIFYSKKNAYSYFFTLGACDPKAEMIPLGKGKWLKSFKYWQLTLLSKVRALQLRLICLDSFSMKSSGMGEIEKVGDLKFCNLGIKNCSRNTGIEKSRISLVKISPFRMKKFEINEPIQYETFFL